jgi:hypothetical protein
VEEIIMIDLTALAHTWLGMGIIASSALACNEDSGFEKEGLCFFFERWAHTIAFNYCLSM